MPSAMPPWGGAPYSNASSMWPNLRWASSSVMPSDAEDFRLHLAVVDADAAAADLPAVADEVVGALRTTPGSVSRRCSSSGTAAVKGWCDGVPALVLVVPLEEREVHDEGEVTDGVVHQAEAATELAPEGVEHLVRFVLAVGDDEEHVAAVGAGEAGHLARLVLGEELGDRGAYILHRQGVDAPVAAELHRDEAAAAVLLDEGR